MAVTGQYRVQLRPFLCPQMRLQIIKRRVILQKIYLVSVDITITSPLSIQKD